MDLETAALMVLLSQVTHELKHMQDNAKSQDIKDKIQPVLTALTAAVAGLVSA